MACQCRPDNITNVEVKKANDKSLLKPVAAHERTDIEVTEDMKNMMILSLMNKLNTQYS